MKIPFDVKFRPQIESGEYRVETQAGCPVRIVCWDMACELPILGLVLLNDEKAEEMAVGFTNEGTNLLGEPLYDKLFIVTPEEELTEFEKELESFYNHHLQVCTYDNQGTVEDSLHDGASKLLALARKDLCDQIVDHTKEAYENGKADAFKDLPRWNESRGVYSDGWINDGFLYYKNHSIQLSSLEKLPGFKED